MRSTLLEYFPAAVQAFEDLAAPDALSVLARAADPDRAAKLTRGQLVAALRTARRHHVETKADQARQARCLAEDTRARLVRVRDAMPKPIDARQPRDPGQTITAERPARLDPEAQAMLDWVRAGQAKPATAATSPVPNPLEPDRARQTTTPGPDRGLER